ncbi:MAG: cob(I)yrinic acid a,c-diamide adenosyltransferase [Halobacteriota archaeon]
MVYTGRGDEGETDLASGERVSKSSERIEAYGAVDEANACVGRAAATTDDPDVVEHLEWLQNAFFVVQAELAMPEGGGPRASEAHVDHIEKTLDELEAELDEIDGFVLPGGPAADLHLARAVTRRAERRVVELHEIDGGCENALVVLNRASDLLFQLARLLNQRSEYDERPPTY